MRSLRYGIEVEVSEETIHEEDGETILYDSTVKHQVETLFERPVRQLYLVCGDNEEPVLFIEWASFWREDEEDRYTLDNFAYSDEELLDCYRLGVL